MSRFLLRTMHLGYTALVKPVFFLADPEKVHVRVVRLGGALGESGLIQRTLRGILHAPPPSLRQDLFGLDLRGPFGLAAGFDYEARLTQILPALGFGFGTVGTLTNLPYEGNPRPMLGRLPLSRSLMVNKGFKNLGVAATLARLKGKRFAYPVGVSIGKTNILAIRTQAEAVADVVAGFAAAESSGVPFAYYELNISCPNLAGNIEFYEPAHLEQLLQAVGKLGLSRPVWIKMPIVKSDAETMAMLDVIVRHPFVKAVIFGNLERNRKNPALRPEEVARFPQGNFSGEPCRARSDELIRLAYKEHGGRLKIVGCGGVFNAHHAYRKVRLGASLVQLVTGLIFEGPQLVAEMNEDLAALLHRDGFRNIAEAVGADARSPWANSSPNRGR